MAVVLWSHERGICAKSSGRSRLFCISRVSVGRVPLDKSEGVVKDIVFLCGAKHRWGSPEKVLFTKYVLACCKQHGYNAHHPEKRTVT
jgi:hypothetical protein